MRVKTTRELERELSGTASLERYLNRNNVSILTEQPLMEELNRIMREKDLHRTDIIAKSSLNDIYVHQIMSGKRHPSREKLLCLFFGMELDAETAQRVLKSCGYPPLYARKRRDAAVLYAMGKGMTLLQCNEALVGIGEDPLG